MQKDLDKKSVEIKLFNKAKAEIARLKREKDELKSTREAEIEQKLNKKQNEEKLKIQKNVDAKSNPKLFEKNKVIEQLNNQLRYIRTSERKLLDSGIKPDQSSNDSLLNLYSIGSTK